MEWFWVPRNTTMAEIKRLSKEQGFDYPQLAELIPCLYAGGVLAVAQIIIQRYVLTNIGLAYLQTTEPRKPGQAVHAQEAKILDKISESAWKFLCYSCLLTYGGFTLLRKPWIWDPMDYYSGYPIQEIDLDVKYYYLAELSLYISLLLTHFMGPKRKDFWMLVAHHIATLTLLSLSWGLNLVRIGSAIALCHDCADVPLEACKMGIYFKSERFKDRSFLVFLVVWTVTRLGIYPFYLFWTHARIVKENPNLPGGNWVCFALLFFILVLNIYWSYFIGKMAYKSITADKLEDSRSSDEEVDDERSNNKNK